MSVHRKQWRTPDRYKKWLRYSDHEREWWIRGTLGYDHFESQPYHCVLCYDAFHEGHSAAFWSDHPGASEYAGGHEVGSEADAPDEEGEHAV